MQLIAHTVREKQTDQNYVLLEGVCNSHRLQEVDDQLEQRHLDDL